MSPSQGAGSLGCIPVSVLSSNCNQHTPHQGSKHTLPDKLNPPKGKKRAGAGWEVGWSASTVNSCPLGGVRNGFGSTALVESVNSLQIGLIEMGMP